METVGGELWQASVQELVAAVVAVETRRRQDDAEILQLLSVMDSRGVAAELGYSNLYALLVHLLRITRQDAKHRLDQAAELFSQTTPTGVGDRGGVAADR